MNIIKKIILFMARSIFYIYGFLWTIIPKRYDSIEEIINDFYINFLRIDKKYVHILKINKREAIIRCDNPCPILKLSMILKLDTKFVCRYISEPVCEYVLKRMNSKIIFKRNYDHIRPYKESCEEHIYFQ
ncbi:MAG: hypothetical protein NO475_04740 [Candidatus Methanomethylicia archaeon]|jgi:hypothetical protein|nr:hypothetical protein [Candidatus Methanomethylicia archaeon]